MASPHQSSTPGQSQTSSQPPPSATRPVEMADLDTSKTTATGAGVGTGTGAGAGSQGGLLDDVMIPATSPITSSMPNPTTSSSEMTKQTDISPESTAPTSSTPAEPSSNAAVSSSTNDPSSTGAPVESSLNAPPITRFDSVAIGPAGESTSTAAASDASQALLITLLLTSGARHPYKIDEKYLTKRNVSVPGVTDGGRKDPYSISVYTLKELILREWRDEWEAKPSSPSSIRLIYFGRLLDDKTPLKGMLYFATPLPLTMKEEKDNANL
ncbi:hypothetical protein PVAG01_00938 [Phlyctema vagabunda]|uniref:UBL3-like ubiquitin domain-containing protein n=1 Tax=Phlyctema vagabunda TaxID=108571 RepID=A0ABR4PVP9_9HELO